MSGLDTVAGAAGLISLGIQLGESAVKLKRLFHAIKNAPRTVSRVAFELETMAIALRQLERHRLQNPRHTYSMLLERCVGECRRWTAEIKQLVNQMEARMLRNPKLGGRIYAAFKQRDVQELLGELERAKSSLELSYMMYLAEEQRRRDQAYVDSLAAQGILLQSIDTQVRTVKETTTTLQQVRTDPQALKLRPTPTQDSKVLESMGSGNVELSSECTRPSTGFTHASHQKGPMPARLNKRHSKQNYRFILRLPTWLCRRVWDLALMDTQCAWNMSLRTFNIVPRDSPVFYYVKIGDIPNFRRLVDNGKASLLDVSESTFFCVDKKHYTGPWLTLLEVAASSGQLEMCQYLLDQVGTWPDQSCLLASALAFAIAGANLTGQRTFAFYRLLMSATGFDCDFYDDFCYRWLYFCPDAESLDIIIQSLCSGSDSNSYNHRFELASRPMNVSASSFIKCIGLELKDERLAFLKNSDGATVLTCVARHVRRILEETRSETSEDDLQAWLRIGISVLQHGADPHNIARAVQLGLSWAGRYASIEEWQYAMKMDVISLNTPLLDCLRIHCLRTNAWTGQNQEGHGALAALRVWTQMIVDAGLDLEVYGLQETETWESLRVQSSLYCVYDADVTQLVYGPSPLDWSIKTSYQRTVWTYELKKYTGRVSSLDKTAQGDHLGT